MVEGAAATGSAFGVARPNRVAINNGPADEFDRSLGPAVGELVERLRLRGSEGHQAIPGLIFHARDAHSLQVAREVGLDGLRSFVAGAAG